MKTIIKSIIYTAITIFVFACGGGGDDAPAVAPEPENSAPSQSQLIFPSENLLCIDNSLAFNWSVSVDPDGDAVSYKVTIAKDRALTDIVEQFTVTGTGLTITLEKAVAYYWRVIAVDSKGNESDPTPISAFYTEGDGISNYAPFTAALVSPESNSFLDAGSVSLTWDGGDTDVDDVLTFELFFGETNDPVLVAGDLSTETSDVTVETGKTYYWKVNTLDDSGAKTIGQVWTFNVN